MVGTTAITAGLRSHLRDHDTHPLPQLPAPPPPQLKAPPRRSRRRSSSPSPLSCPTRGGGQVILGLRRFVCAAELHIVHEARGRLEPSATTRPRRRTSYVFSSPTTPAAAHINHAFPQTASVSTTSQHPDTSNDIFNSTTSDQSSTIFALRLHPQLHLEPGPLMR